MMGIKQTRKRLPSALLLLFFSVVTAISPLFSVVSSASGVVLQDITDRARNYSYYSVIMSCTEQSGVQSKNNGGGYGIEWALSGYVDGVSANGMVKCNQIPWDGFAKAVGYSGATDQFFLDLGWQKILGGNSWTTPSVDTFKNVIATMVAGKVPTSIDDGIYVALTRAALLSDQGCKLTNRIEWASASQSIKDLFTSDSIMYATQGNTRYVRMQDLNSNNTATTYLYQTSVDMNNQVYAYPLPSHTTTQTSCRDLIVQHDSSMAALIPTLTTAQQRSIIETALANSACSSIDKVKLPEAYTACRNSIPSVLTECLNTKYYTYKISDIGNNYAAADLAACVAQKTGGNTTQITAALLDAIKQVGTASTGVTPAVGPLGNCPSGQALVNGKCAAPAVICAGGTLGWLLCPLTNVFTDIINMTAGLLNSLLFISPIGSNTQLQTVWRTFLGFANLLLVIAFLIVIFSQATSLGLSAYGIKKMLPRIIAAAILINLSYFICTLALDLVNVVGGSMGSLIQSITPSATTSGGEVLDRSASWASWIGLSVGALMAGAIAAAVGAIAFVVPFLLTIAIAVIAIFLIVILRQLIVILLVIVAPLAFAAMVLPNTEQLFTKWRKLFVNMLAMYPVAVFLLYGSQLVGSLILVSKNVVSETGGNGWAIDLVATAAMTVGPFVGLYMYLKSSNKLFAMAANAVNKAGAGLRKASTGWAKEKQQNSRFAGARAWSKQVRDADRVERFGKTTGPQGVFNRANSYAAGVGLRDPRKWGPNAKKYQASAVNRAAINDDKIFKEDKDNAAAAFAQNGIQGPLMVAHARSGRVVRDSGKKDAQGKAIYEYGRKLTESEHAASIEWTMANGKLAERMEVYGADWASAKRSSGNRRALDTLNDGYFHVNKDVARFGNTFGGKMTTGTVGGDKGVNNAILSNMAVGKTSAEAIIDNDMAQRLANISALSDSDLIAQIDSTESLSKAAAAEGKTSAEFVANFRKNAKTVATTVLNTRELNAKVKPEFAGAIREMSTGTPDPLRVAGAQTENLERERRAAELAADRPQQDIDIVDNFDNIAPST